MLLLTMAYASHELFSSCFNNSDCKNNLHLEIIDTVIQGDTSMTHFNLITPTPQLSIARNT